MKRTSISDFGKRLKEAFQNKQNKEIAMLLGVTDSAISGYMVGKLPAVENLIQVSRITGFSIGWLLTGQGDKLVDNKISKFTSILVCGYKGGIGTSLSTTFIALCLALKGKKVLIVDNKNGNQTRAFATKKFLDIRIQEQKFPRDKHHPLEKCRFIDTEIPNLEIFSSEGVFLSHSRKSERHFNQTGILSKKYDFIICDVSAHENPFRSEDLIFNPVLENSEIIIPYEPTRSNINDLKTILKFIQAEEEFGFQASLLGVFITNEKDYRRESQLYLDEIKEVESIVKDKFLMKVIKDVSGFGEIAELEKKISLNQIRNTRIFQDYYILTEEILERINNKH